MPFYVVFSAKTPPFFQRGQGGFKSKIFPNVNNVTNVRKLVLQLKP